MKHIYNVTFMLHLHVLVYLLSCLLLRFLAPPTSLSSEEITSYSTDSLPELCSRRGLDFLPSRPFLSRRCLLRASARFLSLSLHQEICDQIRLCTPDFQPIATLFYFGSGVSFTLARSLWNETKITGGPLYSMFAHPTCSLKITSEKSRSRRAWVSGAA